MKKRSNLYMYMTVIFSIAIMVYSIWLMFQASEYYRTGDTGNFYFALIAGIIGLFLAGSSITRLRRSVSYVSSLMKQVSTVVVCDKCGFKVVRAFKVGDYVNKPEEKCKQCGENMYVSSIYAEEPKKKG